MKTLVRGGLTYIVLATFASAECYSKQGDVTETIRFDKQTGGLVWEHAGKRVEFESGSGGTGVDYRVAFDPNGKGFRYEFDGDDLIFGGVRYVKGCGE